MNSFLQLTARAIMAQTDWQQLSRTTLVLPSHRAGLVLKDEILRLQQEQHARAVWAPQVQTLPQLQDYLSPLYPEDELMTVVRLYRLYRQTAVSTQAADSDDLMPLDMFYGWGRQMIADFTNVDASMPAEQVPNFFENTIAAHELEQWKLDAETEERLRSLIHGERAAASAEHDSVRARYEVLWKQLYELYAALQAEMRAEQKGYAGMRQRAVIAHWDDEALQAKIAGRTYIFVGFNYLLPVERELMQRLRDAGQAQFYWDYVPDFQTNEKAFSFAKLNSGILGGQPFPVTRNPSPVTLIACASHEAQAQYVHRWLQDNYTEKGQKVGVVICDETMLESVIYTLPAVTLPGKDEPEPINITKGFPLRNTAIYSRVMAWLDAQSRGQAEKVVSPDFIDSMLDELFPITDTPSPITDNSSFTWQELLILESEYQVRKIVNQMRLIAVNGLGDVPFTRKLLKLLMRRTMESVTMPFHGEPVTDIQVMGVLETRMLDFDKLLILNVEEGVIPQRQSDLSFIPFYLRKAYHMQTPDERATVYAYNFFRLLSRAGHSTLLYATADTSDGGKGMSRFVIQMLYSPEFEVTTSTLIEPSELSPASDMAVRQQSLRSLLQVNEHGVVTRKDGTPYALSPSAMNTYITCKRSFYLQYVLGLRPKRDEDVLYDAATLGSFVHHAMHFLYTRYLGCDNIHQVPVKPEQFAALRTDEAKKQEALLAAYEAMNAEWAKENGAPLDLPHYVPEHHSGENVIILGYMDNILERDEADAAQGLQLYMLEQGNYFAVQVDEVGIVNTGGFIDRLDILGAPGAERLRVIDYKSGSYHDDTHRKKMSATWEELMESEDKGYVRQTFVYSHAVMSKDWTGLPIEPNLYFCSRKLTEIETTIDIEDQTVHDYRQYEEPMTKALQTKIKEIMTTTDFPCCDEKNCPSFCPFFDLCGRKKNDF